MRTLKAVEVAEQHGLKTPDTFHPCAVCGGVLFLGDVVHVAGDLVHPACCFANMMPPRPRVTAIFKRPQLGTA